MFRVGSSKEKFSKTHGVTRLGCQKRRKLKKKKKWGMFLSLTMPSLGLDEAKRKAFDL